MANEFLQPSFFDNSTAKNPDVDVALLEEQSNVRSILSLAGATTLQTVAILDGSITPTGAHIAVDTEGQAPSDDLTSINHIRSEVDVIHDGMILQLQAVDDARMVTVKNSSEVGGIRTISGQDIVLGTSWRLELQYLGGSWVEIAGRAQIDADAALSNFSTTAAVGKAPVAIYGVGGSVIYDQTVLDAIGITSIKETIPNLASTDLSNLTSDALANAKIAPRPQTAGGIGQFLRILTENADYTLPAGGTWAVFAVNIVSNEVGATLSHYNNSVGIYGGGHTFPRYSGYLGSLGFAWRIA